MKPLIRKILGVSLAILGGAVSIWMVRTGETWAIGVKESLCVLNLQSGAGHVCVPFRTSKPLERFCVVSRPEARGERLSLAITGENNFLCSFSAITKPMRFSFSPGAIPVGTYTAVLRQETGNQGGRAIIAERWPGLTGWQILSRAYLGGLVISGMWAGVMRKSKSRWRVISSFTFHSLLLACVLIVVYLLLHEGGHALGASLFGRYDWTRSDFWGIHGNPHSGIKASMPVEPWQRAIESFAGPMFPTLMGWVFFLLWRSRTGKQMCSGHPRANTYFTAIVCMSLFPFVAVLGCLLGLISDGDWRGFIENVPGPLWLVKALVCGVLLVNGFILWHVVPELWRAWKAYKAEIETGLRQPGNKT